MVAFLFDFDGTLAIEKSFLKRYFEELLRFFKRKGVNVTVDLLMGCVEEITRNPNDMDNFRRFSFCMERRTSTPSKLWEEWFLEFYSSDIFDSLKDTIEPNEEVVKMALEKKREGLLVLASNPVLPRIAMVKRLNWIGLSEDLFDLITDMEGFHYCKPDPRYYLEICEKLGVPPERCVMYGDDEINDGVCEKVGIKFVKVAPVRQTLQ